MDLLWNEAMTGSLKIVEILATLAALKTKQLSNDKFLTSLVRQEENNLLSTRIDPSIVVNMAYYLLELDSPNLILSTPSEWQDYRWHLKESLEDYLHSAPRSPNLSSIETTESYLVDAEINKII